MQIVPVTHELSTTNVVPTVEDRIIELVETVRAQRERIATLEARNDAAKQELRQLLEMRGESWADDDGYARLVPESKRISYETKALDDLIIREPLHYGWLKDFRKESVVRSSIQIK